MSLQQKGQFMRVGLPFIVMTVGGWYGLSQLVQGKVDVQVSARPCLSRSRSGDCLRSACTNPKAPSTCRTRVINK
jgi:hypothetical protein